MGKAVSERPTPIITLAGALIFGLSGPLLLAALRYVLRPQALVLRPPIRQHTAR